MMIALVSVPGFSCAMQDKFEKEHWEIGKHIPNLEAWNAEGF